MPHCKGEHRRLPPLSQPPSVLSKSCNPGSGERAREERKPCSLQVGVVRTPLRGGTEGVVYGPTLTSKAERATEKAMAAPSRG